MPRVDELADELSGALFRHADPLCEFGDGDAPIGRHQRDDSMLGKPQAVDPCGQDGVPRAVDQQSQVDQNALVVGRNVDTGLDGSHKATLQSQL